MNSIAQRAIQALAALLLTTMVPTAPAADHAPLAPITLAQTDARGCFHVNGKPFFPILLYNAPVDPAALQEFATMGFNTLNVSSAKDAAALPAHGFYGAVHAQRKVDDTSGVLLAMGVDSPALSFKDNMVHRTVTANKSVSANCPGRPVMNAIGYWLNEPAGVKAGTLPPKSKYEDLVAAIDVAAPYLYPVPHQPVSSVGDAVARARLATGGKRPLLPILQLFTWNPGDRYPTPAELRCMVNLALIEGATGIGYYSYKDVKDSKHPVPAELWQSVGPLNAEVAEDGPFLTSSMPDLSVAAARTPKPVIRWRAAKRGADGLLLLANPTNQMQTILLNLPNASSVPKRADKEGGVTIKDGLLAVNLEPFEVARLHYTTR